MSRFELWSGDDDEVFVITRGQLRDFAVGHALYGQNDFEAERYEDAAYGEGSCDRCARDYNRLRRLHDVMAGHLAKARAELAELRDENAAMGEELDLWRGSVSNVAGNVPPAHYAGDGYVTCSRALESASAQGTVISQAGHRLPMAPDDEQAPGAQRGACDFGQGGLVERRVRPHLKGQGPRPHARQGPGLLLLLRPPQARAPDKTGLGRAEVLFSIRIEMGTRGFPFRAREGVWTLQAVWRLGRSHSQEDRM